MIAHTTMRQSFLVATASKFISSKPLQMQGMPDVARAIIAYKTCTGYSVPSKSQAQSAFTCNMCQVKNVEHFTCDNLVHTLTL